MGRYLYLKRMVLLLLSIITTTGIRLAVAAKAASPLPPSGFYVIGGSGEIGKIESGIAANSRNYDNSSRIIFQ